MIREREEPNEAPFCHGLFERSFEGPDDPDLALEVTFTGPNGAARTVPGFWDGGGTFRVRFAPDQPGRWRFETHGSHAALDLQTGTFDVRPYDGPLALFRHGPPQVADTGTHLVHADRTPFFFLADTAWNGPLKAWTADWNAYLSTRANMGFTAVQVVLTPWLAAAADAQGRLAFQASPRLRFDPVFFQRLDRRMAAIARHGLVAVPVLLWAATWNPDAAALNPGVTLTEEQAIAVGRYLLARYGAQPAVWVLAGDGEYTGAAAQRWRRIGRAVFQGHEHLTATMHPGGQHWPAEALADEPWYKVIGYQSGHWREPTRTRWLTEGPPTRPANRPVINLEPCYEGIRPVGQPRALAIDEGEVRRACYTSMLVSPTAGVAYGAHGTWSWEEQPVEPMNHPGNGAARPWVEALLMPGGQQLKHLRALFRSLPWWTLRPAPHLLADQPGRDDPDRFVAVAAAADRRCLVAYVPAGATLRLRGEALAPGVEASWFDPRTGGRRPADGAFVPPSAGDWVLVARPPGASRPV